MLIMPFNVNGARFRPDDAGGLYESYFQRANHPSRPLAFWIRYTVFSPRAHAEEARGELWAIFFDGETGRIAAVKEVFPISDCDFSPTQLNVHIGSATLSDGDLQGRAASSSHALAWSLHFADGQPPLLLLPEAYYERALPRAKALVGTPNAVYSGSLTVDGESISVACWRGSQNHNWGRRHTDRYAWGQVAGFDNAPESFLECCTAQVKLGPVWTPQLSLLVLRDEGREVALNGVLQSVRASATYGFFTWTIDSRGPQARIHGCIHAPASAFVGLTYDNPPGGQKTCLNSKLASAEITVECPGKAPRILLTQHRAAFEILTDRTDHGVPVVS